MIVGAEEAAGTADAGNPEATDAPEASSSVATGDDGKTAEGTPPLADNATSSDEPKAWVKQLEGDLQKNEVLTQFESISALGKAHLETVGKLKKSVTVPAEDASDEEKAAYRKAMGVPEKPTDYKLEQLELPKGATENEAFKTAFLEEAHNRGLTQDQVAGFYKWYTAETAKTAVENLRVVKTSQADAEKELRDAWGGRYDRNLALTFRGLAPYAERFPDLKVALGKSGLGNHVGFIMLLSRLGELEADHKFVDGQHTSVPVGGEVGQRSTEELAGIMYPDQGKDGS